MEAPLFHPLRTALSTSITVDKTYQEVVPFIVDAITNCGIVYHEKSHCVYSCTCLVNNDLVRFETRIYLNKDETYLIEFKQLSGDRFLYAEILAHISEQLSTPIPGARLFRTNDEMDLENMESRSDFMCLLLEKGACRDNQIQGMQLLAACARDLSTSTKASEYFGSEGKWMDLVSRVIDITVESISTDQEMCLIGVSVITDIKKAASAWSKEMLTNVSNLYRDIRRIKGELAPHFLTESRKL